MCITAFREGITAVSQNALLLKPANRPNPALPLHRIRGSFDPPKSVL